MQAQATSAPGVSVACCCKFCRCCRVLQLHHHSRLTGPWTVPVIVLATSHEMVLLWTCRHSATLQTVNVSCLIAACQGHDYCCSLKSSTCLFLTNKSLFLCVRLKSFTTNEKLEDKIKFALNPDAVSCFSLNGGLFIHEFQANLRLTALITFGKISLPVNIRK